MITSPSNPRVKNVIKLRDRRPRKQQGLFLIDGQRQIERAIAAGVVPRELFVPLLASANESINSTVDRAAAAGAEIIEVADAILAKISYGDRQNDLVAVAETPSYDLANLQLPADALVIVVEGLEKPGNLGAILRTADAAGCDAVIIADPVTEITNPNVVRASMGALFNVPVGQADSSEVLAWLRERNYSLRAARVDGAIDYSAASYDGSTAIVLGSEAHGLTDVWRGEDIQAIRLPMHGGVDSLNVSVTAAVLMYEAQRQRRC